MPPLFNNFSEKFLRWKSFAYTTTKLKASEMKCFHKGIFSFCDTFFFFIKIFDYKMKTNYNLPYFLHALFIQIHYYFSHMPIN